MRRFIILGAALVIGAFAIARANTTIDTFVFDTLFNITSNGTVMLGATPGHAEFPGSSPSLGANCGTGATIGGNDVAGRITLGTSPGGYCAVNFAASWVNAPVCSVWNETTGARSVFPQPNTSGLAIVGASSLNAGDVLSYQCVGYQ